MSSAVQELVAESKPILQGAANLTNDPSIKESLDNLRQSAENIKEITANGAGMASDGKKMTADTAEMVHRYTRPAKSTWGAIKGIGKWFLQAFTAFK